MQKNSITPASKTGDPCPLMGGGLVNEFHGRTFLLAGGEKYLIFPGPCGNDHQGRIGWQGYPHT